MFRNIAHHFLTEGRGDLLEAWIMSWGGKNARSAKAEKPCKHSINLSWDKIRRKFQDNYALPTKFSVLHLQLSGGCCYLFSVLKLSAHCARLRTPTAGRIEKKLLRLKTWKMKNGNKVKHVHGQQWIVSGHRKAVCLPGDGVRRFFIGNFPAAYCCRWPQRLSESRKHKVRWGSGLEGAV